MAKLLTQTFELADIEKRPGADVTPTGGFNLVLGSPGDQLKGTAGNDKATLDSVANDKDGVIQLGAGDDVFVFGVHDNTLGEVNGIVKMGDGGNDRVFLTHSVNDYEFSLRSDGGIKITYIGDDSDATIGHGASVTFYGAEEFTFRNIDYHNTSVNYVNTVFTHDQLYGAIQDSQVWA